MFEPLSVFIEKMDLLNDDDYINNCDFLFNLIDIVAQVEEKKRDYVLLDAIINVSSICFKFC